MPGLSVGDSAAVQCVHVMDVSLAEPLHLPTRLWPHASKRLQWIHFLASSKRSRRVHSSLLLLIASSLVGMRGRVCVCVGGGSWARVGVSEKGLGDAWLGGVRGLAALRCLRAGHASCQISCLSVRLAPFLYAIQRHTFL